MFDLRWRELIPNWARPEVITGLMIREFRIPSYAAITELFACGARAFAAGFGSGVRISRARPPIIDCALETACTPRPSAPPRSDSGGRLLATASFDKTGPVVAAVASHCLVLRPAIGFRPGSELLPSPSRPDGRFVVTGVWTGFRRGEGETAFIFRDRDGASWSAGSAGCRR